MASRDHFRLDVLTTPGGEAAAGRRRAGRGRADAEARPGRRRRRLWRLRRPLRPGSVFCWQCGKDLMPQARRDGGRGVIERMPRRAVPRARRAGRRDRGYRRLLRWAALPVTDRRWAAPLCGDRARLRALRRRRDRARRRRHASRPAPPQIIEIPGLAAGADAGEEAAEGDAASRRRPARAAPARATSECSAEAGAGRLRPGRVTAKPKREPPLRRRNSPSAAGIHR